MKILILTAFLTLMTIFVQGQCNCETINRDDGTTVSICPTLPIAYDNTTQVGLAIGSNGHDKFVTLTVRFKAAAKDIIGDLSIRLDNNFLMTLELINAQLAYIGNSQLAQGVFLAMEADIVNFKKSEIKTISFKLKDKLLRTFQTTSNADVLKKQLDCL